MPVVEAFGAVRFQAGSAGDFLFWVWVDAGFSPGVGQLLLDAPFIPCRTVQKIPAQLRVPSG